MKAIIYESRTGSTMRYAKLLSEETGLPAYPRKEVKGFLKEGDEIIYMGWLMVGAVVGYPKMKKKYKIAAIVAVGMHVPTEKVIREIRQRHRLANKELFYLQGGFDINNLRGVYKFMMNIMRKTIGEPLEKKRVKTDEETELLDMLKNGKNYVSKENLMPILEWFDK